MIKVVDLKMGRFQALFIGFVWLILFTLPVLFVDTWDSLTWIHVFKVWREYGIVFLLFLLNRFVLLPHIFFQGHRVAYFLTVMFTIVLFSFILYQFEGQGPIKPSQKGGFPRQNISQSAESPHRPMHPPLQSETGLVEGVRRIPPTGRSPEGMRPFQPEVMLPPFVNIFIISFLLLGFDTGLMFSAKWVESEQTKLKLEKESVENKMAFLQSQVSPHFFMNTLNNIHALIDISSDEAKSAVIKLSHMMNYMLYETQSEKVDIHQELTFIKSYVELMKLRFTDDVEVVLDLPDQLPNINVPPLLTISYIENAFKHGVSYEHDSFITIVYKFSETHLFFNVSNSNHSKPARDNHSGLGLVNAKKRLDLIYSETYELGISNSVDPNFNIQLTLPL